MAARKPRGKAAKGHQLPEPIPKGFKIQDTQKKSWIIDEVIGSGGFGTVYYAADAAKPKNLDYVIKVEYHANGPLFAEMHCYQKIAKPSTLKEWMKNKKIDYLGLSPCHGFGSFELNGSKYRFMVLERFDTDLQKLFEENDKRFPLKTVCRIGISIIDVLEYIHSCGYIHGDVKAANLLLGRKRGTENQVYLVDMGLACKYLREDKHKPDLPDLKKAHNGTPEFTSRDAHRGSFSRRSDLEILMYNLLQWLVGRLPWEDYINDNNKLQKEKEKHMSDVKKFLDLLFKDKNCPKGIAQLLHYVNTLGFEEEPNYKKCKQLLMDDLKSTGSANSGPLDFTKEKTRKLPSATSSQNTDVHQSGPCIMFNFSDSDMAIEETEDDTSEMTESDCQVKSHLDSSERKHHYNKLPKVKDAVSKLQKVAESCPCVSGNKKLDEYDMFTQHIAGQLRKLSSRRFIIVQEKIQSLVTAELLNSMQPNHI